MKFFFEPNSIALVGASQKLLGRNLITNVLMGGKDRIYPVNPNYEEILNIRCYPSVEDIPDDVDIAIILAPAYHTPEILNSCARKGVKGAIIQTGGFAEIGVEGKALQDKCVAIAKKAGMRLWGPNCMGLVDIPKRKFFVFTFPSIFESGVIPGRISMVVQSGALASGFLPELMNHLKIGISKLCSIGNKADIDDCDLLEYLLQDKNTDVVALYMESIPRGRLFLSMVSQASKPIVVLKAGVTDSGARAALSHTASLAGDARLTRGLLEASGAQIAEDFNEMVDYARTLAVAGHLNADSRMGVITFSGGASTLICDLFEKRGIYLAHFSGATLKALSTIFPSWMPPGNPVDLGAAVQTVDGYGPISNRAVEIVLRDPGVDIGLIHFFLLGEVDFDLENLKKTADQIGKVLIFVVVGFQKNVDAFRQKAQKLGLAVFSEIGRAADCVASAIRYRLKNTEIRSLSIQEMLKKEYPTQVGIKHNGPIKIYDEFESKRILSSSGIPVVEEEIVSNLADAKRYAMETGYPVTLKGLPPDTIHKSEKGLVELNLYMENQIEEAFSRIETKLNGKGKILIQRQVKIDYELIAGYLKDDHFGPCVLFGIGGFFAELEPDIAFSLAPLNRDQVDNLMGRIRSQKLFQGFRKMNPLNREITADLLIKLSNLGASRPEIKQIDINPIAVSHGTPIVIDANIIFSAKD